MARRARSDRAYKYVVNTHKTQNVIQRFKNRPIARTGKQQSTNTCAQHTHKKMEDPQCVYAPKNYIHIWYIKKRDKHHHIKYTSSSSQEKVELFNYS